MVYSSILDLNHSFRLMKRMYKCKSATNVVQKFLSGTDESYTDVELPLKPLLFHVLISRPYVVCPRAAPKHTQIALASVMRNFNKKIDRKNINFGNETAIKKNIHG